MSVTVAPGLTLRQNRLKLHTAQDKATRVILGTTGRTPTETMRFMLDLPPMQIRQKVEQVEAYLSAVEGPHTPLQETAKAPIHFWTQSNDPASCYGKPEERINEI